MVDTNHFSNIAKDEEISVETVADGNGLVTYTKQWSQHSSGSNNHRNKRCHPQSAHSSRNSPLSNRNLNQYDQGKTKSMHVVIIAPEEYRNMITKGKNLFGKFQVPFEHDKNKLLNVILDRKKGLNICLVHKNRLIPNLDDPLSDRDFSDDSVLYVLILSSKESAQSKENSLELYNPSTLFKRSDVFLRIYKKKQNKQEKDQLFRIKRPGSDITLGEVIKQAFDKFDPDTHEIYYYAYKLSPDLRPWHQNCVHTNDQDTMPIIFDIVITPSEQAVKSIGQLTDVPVIKMDKLTTDSTIECEAPNRASLYENYAYTLYIRLRLDAAMPCQEKNSCNKNEEKKENETTSDKNNFNKNEKKEENEKISDMLHNFYLFCDKDKSGKLDPCEETVGLLTLFKYIDDGGNQLNADILLPIVYPKSSKKEHQDTSNEEGFRSLIIDTLTEHLRIQTFPHPNHPRVQFDEINKKLARISSNIEKTLTEHLQRDKDQYQSPFSFTNILKHIALFLLCFIFLPIVVFYTIISNLWKNRASSKFPIIRVLIIILISIIVTLVSSIIYLIITEIVLYYIYYDENSQWHVSALEVYWPLALIISIVFIACFYGSPFLANNDYTKNKQIELYYSQAELDMLKHQAEIVCLEGKERKPKTMSEWESQQNISSKDSIDERKDFNKTNYWMKLIKDATSTYKFEKKSSTTPEKVINILLLILIVCIAVIHGCFPTIYRNSNTNYTYPTNTTKSVYVQLVEITFISDCILIYLIFLLMITYAYHLCHTITFDLNKIVRQTANNNEYTIARKDDYYLDLKHSINLDLFLSQIRNTINIKDDIKFQLAMASVGIAFLLDLILGIVAIVRLLLHGIGGLITLTTTFILLDIIILSLMIIGFLIHVAMINTTATKNVQQLLLRTKKEVLNQTSSDTMMDKNANVIYLSAMAEQLSANQNLYSITVFGFMIDNSLVVKIGLLLLGQAFAAFVTLLKKEVNTD